MGMKYRARVSDKYYVNESERFLYVKLELLEPNAINFAAGQYVSLKVAERGERRSYSIATTPDVTHGIGLLVEMIPQGLGSDYLTTTSIGSEVEIVGPLGRFVVHEPDPTTESQRLFIATGSGIVPIWSMIHDLLLNKHETAPVRLHWGMKKESDLFWIDHLERLRAVYSNFVYDIVLSRGSESWELCQGHVQDCLDRDFPNGSLAKWAGYVCGSPEIVEDICRYLETHSMKKELIFHEKFT
jgi:NAD(P)H-flavin reductase